VAAGPLTGDPSSIAKEDGRPDTLLHEANDVAEPPELYGQHVPTIIFQTSDSCTCKPDNSGSLSGVLGET
jgi:hypothetical protein